jgi:type I restriction enzyme, S subunit
MSTLAPRPIKDYCLGIYDGPHATPEESDEGPIFLGIKNITDDGRIDLSDVRHVSENQFPKWTRRVTPSAGDVVFTYEATLHRYAVIPTDFRGCLGRRVALVRPNTSLVDSRYLLYYFLSSAWRGVIEGNVMSGATVDRIPLERFPEFPVELPSLAVQKRVVAVLSNYDDLIENNRRRMALLEDSARQLYREWFVRLRFPGHEHTPIVDGVPQGWSIGSVSDFYETSSGGTPSRKIPEYFTGDIPWVKTQELNNGFITETSEKITEDALKNSSAKLFPKLTVLIALYGATVGELGITAYTAATNQACCAVLMKDPRGHFTHAFLFFRENKDVLVNLSAGAAQKNISQQIVRGVPMLMPTTALMSTFTEIVSPVFEQILNLQLTNQKLRQARDLLLPRLMSGELAV